METPRAGPTRGRNEGKSNSRGVPSSADRVGSIGVGETEGIDRSQPTLDWSRRDNFLRDSRSHVLRRGQLWCIQQRGRLEFRSSGVLM